MARTTHVVVGALLIPTLALAQRKPVLELGTSLGLTITSSAVVLGGSVTRFGAPGAGILGQPTIYAAVFAGKGVIIEPQLALNITSSGGQTATTVGLAAQFGYLFDGPERNSLLLAGSLAYQSISHPGTSSDEVGLGAKVGYRVLAGSSVGLRFEAGYRRWFDSHLNEFTFGIGLGGIFHHSH